MNGTSMVIKILIIVMLVTVVTFTLWLNQHHKEIEQLLEWGDTTLDTIELMHKFNLKVCEHLDSLYRRTDAIMGDTTLVKEFPLDLLKKATPEAGKE